LIIVWSNKRCELAHQINFSYIRAGDQMPKHVVPIVAAVFVMLFLWLSTVPLLSWYEFSAQHQALQDATFQWNRHALRNYSIEVEISANRRPPRLEPIRIDVREAKFLATYRVGDDEVIDLHSQDVRRSRYDSMAGTSGDVVRFPERNITRGKR
jgi:hypothetical protein